MIAAYTYICCITSLKKTPLYRSLYCSFGDPGARNVSICKKGQSLTTCIKANSEDQIEWYISESINMIIGLDKQAFQCKIAISVYTCVLGAQKNCLSSFEHPKHMLKIMCNCKECFYNFMLKSFVYLNL